MEKVMYITDKPQSCELCEFCIENHDYNSLGRITLKNYSCVGLGRKEFETVEEMKKHCPLVDYSPTVKAIPIEWLNKRAEEIAFAYWTNARNKITLPLNELPLLIDQIIREWEKENESNFNR